MFGSLGKKLSQGIGNAYKLGKKVLNNYGVPIAKKVNEILDKNPFIEEIAGYIPMGTPIVKTVKKVAQTIEKAPRYLEEADKLVNRLEQAKSFNDYTDVAKDVVSFGTQLNNLR
jgi:hypothetical protein